HALLIFARRRGIRNNATTGLDVGDAAFHHHGAERDAGIEIAGKIEIENPAGINSAARALQLLDDLHGTNFGCAGHRAGRKTGHQRVETIHVLAQAPAQAGNQMHDVRVALDSEQFLGLHRAVVADAPKIVASQIYEHDVLSALLFAGKHFALEALVFGFVLAAPTRAGDGTVENIAALHFDEHFRRAADHGDVIQLQVEKI